MLYDKLLGSVRVGLSLECIKSDIGNMTGQLGSIGDKWRKRNLVTIILIALGLSLFGMVLAGLIGYKLSRPLEKMSKAVEKLALPEPGPEIMFKKILILAIDNVKKIA